MNTELERNSLIYFSLEFRVKKMDLKALIMKNYVRWFYFLHIKMLSY